MEIEEGVIGRCYRVILSFMKSYCLEQLDRYEHRSVRTGFLYCISNLSYLHDISYVQKKQEKRNDLTIFPAISNNLNLLGLFYFR